MCVYVCVALTSAKKPQRFILSFGPSFFILSLILLFSLGSASDLPLNCCNSYVYFFFSPTQGVKELLPGNQGGSRKFGWKTKAISETPSALVVHFHHNFNVGMQENARELIFWFFFTESKQQNLRFRMKTRHVTHTHTKPHTSLTLSISLLIDKLSCTYCITSVQHVC